MMLVMLLVMMSKHPFACGAVNIWMFSILLPTVGQYVHNRTGAVNITTQSNEPTDILQLTPWSSSKIPHISFSDARDWLALAQWARSWICLSKCWLKDSQQLLKKTHISHNLKRDRKSSSLLKKWEGEVLIPLCDTLVPPGQPLPPAQQVASLGKSSLFGHLWLLTETQILYISTLINHHKTQTFFIQWSHVLTYCKQYHETLSTLKIGDQLSKLFVKSFLYQESVDLYISKGHYALCLLQSSAYPQSAFVLCPTLIIS